MTRHIDKLRKLILCYNWLVPISLCYKEFARLHVYRISIISVREMREPEYLSEFFIRVLTWRKCHKSRWNHKFRIWRRLCICWNISMFVHGIHGPLENEPRERPDNAIDNNVSRDITGYNPQQTAGEIAFRMWISHSTFIR